MTISIDVSSIEIKVETVGGKPRVKPTHVPFKIGNVPFNDSAEFDLTPHAGFEHGGVIAHGRVKFLLGQGDTLDGWKVGFFQIVRHNAHHTIHAGRISGEGAIGCHAISELLPTNVFLDSQNDATIPWTFPPDDKTKFKGLVATPSFSDGPNSREPLRLVNHKTSNLINFLLRYWKQTDYWTILTAIGPDQSRQYLAHFHWRVAHDVSCFWKGGVPHFLEQAGSSFEIIDKFVAGPPNDADLQAILTNPKGPTANNAINKAIEKSILGNDSKSHTEFDTWFFSIPELHSFFGVPGMFWN